VAEYKVLGIATTLPFFERVMRHPGFVRGEFDTSFVDTVFARADRVRVRPVEVAVAAAAIRAFRDRKAARLGPTASGPSTSAWRLAGLREAHESHGGR
jgi:acetyl-CoA carboxylase biotin carboxylase subunit